MGGGRRKFGLCSFIDSFLAMSRRPVYRLILAWAPKSYPPHPLQRGISALDVKDVNTSKPWTNHKSALAHQSCGNNDHLTSTARPGRLQKGHQICSSPSPRCRTTLQHTADSPTTRLTISNTQKTMRCSNSFALRPCESVCIPCHKAWRYFTTVPNAHLGQRQGI